MPDRPGKSKVIVSFNGGLATDFGPSFPGGADKGSLALPFLLQADNVYYELDGAPRKIGGASRVNSTAVSGGAFHGLTDVWFQGTGGSETQKRFAYVGTRLLKEDVDGTWDELTTGLEDAREPAFEIFGDKVFWASTSTVDVPRTWDGSAGTTSAVGGSPPNFAFMCKHKGRMWAAGVASNPSRLYYSVFGNAEDWTGAGSGSIDVDPNDGDRLTGLKSHKNELIVFKGPNRLSVHRITGSDPSDFARLPFVSGVGGVNHNTIFGVGDDIVFASPRGLHSLAVTADYGDFLEAFLARPILSRYQDDLNHSVLNTGWGVNYQARGLAVWLFAKSGGTQKNVYLVYDYRFKPGRWSTWGWDVPWLVGNCLAVMQTSARRHRLFVGTTDGYAYECDTATRTVSTASAYTAAWKSPFLNFGSSAHLKTLEGAWFSFQPKGNYPFTFGYTRDGNAETTTTINQGGSASTLA